MKYSAHIEIIPTDKRKKINEYILSSIESNEIKLSKTEIFHLFTGKGGNNEFSLEDFDSPNEYFSNKRQYDLGQYFTSPKSSDKIYSIFNVESNASVFDPTCGHGSFCNSIQYEKNFFGVEYDTDVYKVCKYLFPDANILNKSILDYIPTQRFDYVLSNPPFNMRWEGISSQSFILKKLVDWLNPYGFACIFVPEKYLNDELYYKKDIDFINKKLTHIGTIELPYSFKIYGLKYPVKVLFFQNKPPQNEEDLYNSEIVDEDVIINKIIKLKEERKSNHYTTGSVNNINNFSFSKGDVNNPDALQFILKKYIYEIKRTHPEKVVEAYTLINRLNEERPYGMTDDSWNAYKITPKRLISRIRMMLSKRKNKQAKAKETVYYKNNELLFSKINVPDDITNFFNNFNCFNSQGTKISLFDHQIEHAALHSCKNNSILAHEQGTGKTVTSYAISKYKSKRLNIIIAPAKVIFDVWVPFLNANNDDFSVLKNRIDLNDMPKYLLISYSTMKKNKKHLFKFLKQKINNKQSLLIVDECHYLNNSNTYAFKITHSTFKKVREKLFMSGTPIMNSVEEYFPLLSILYNDTLLNNCKTITSKKENKEIEIPNPKLGCVFGYNGQEYFRKSFCPEKITVFGNQKKNQDVYNTAELKNILDKALTSIKFDDVVKNKYKINTHTLISNSSEKDLYNVILEETHNIIKKYYESTGSAKKDAGLKIIRMIQLLIDSVNLPESFDEYKGKGDNTKMSFIKNEINKKDELIVLGFTRLNAANFYYKKFKEFFDTREVFIITGNIPINKRREILDQHKKSKNGILICTQQSLSEGLNIGYVNEAYIMGLQWNMAKISQWYFRFIRIDQPLFTNINFVIYADSIEANLIKLLKTKEVIVNLNYEEYESKLDDSMLDMILTKEKDKNGKLNIKWGQNNIK